MLHSLATPIISPILPANMDIMQPFTAREVVGTRRVPLFVSVAQIFRTDGRHSACAYYAGV